MKRMAFTLLELLIVLAILIVLIGIIGRTVWSSYEKALVRATSVQIKSFDDALAIFQLENKRFPSSMEGLDLLVGIVNPNVQMMNQQGMMQNGYGMQNTGMSPDMNSGMGMQQNMQQGMMQNPNQMGNMQQGMMQNPNQMGNMQQGMMQDPSQMGNMQQGMMQNPNQMQGMQQGSPMMDPNTGMPMQNMQGNMQQGMMQNPNQMGNMQGMQNAPAQKSYGKYLDMKEIPLDSWGNKYQYEWPTMKGNGKKPAIWSFGPNKVDDQGGLDDIINWDPSEVPAMPNQMQQGMVDPMTGMMMNGGSNMQMDPNMGTNGMQQGMMQNPNSMQNPGMMQNPNPMQNPGMMQTPNQMQNPGMMQTPNQMQNPGMMQNPNQMQNPGMMQNPNQMQNPGMMQNPTPMQNP